MSPKALMVALLIALLVALVLVRPTGAWAQPNPRYAGLVIDAVSGEVFYEDHADRPLYPASLTKMMTLYMTFQALESGQLRLNQSIVVSRHAAGQPPSHLGLPAGSSITVEQAIYALVTKSANDIAVALGEAIGRTESRFARLMTERARQLGMRHTTFRNASGLPNSGQRSTARDMARLAQALLQDFPHHYHYFGTRQWRFRGTTYGNHNRLLGAYDGVDGIKTGYIRAAGFNLVASARRGHLRLIGVVFGGRTAASRNEHMVSLLDRAFDSARGRHLIAHGSMPFTPPIPGRHPVTRRTAPVGVATLGGAVVIRVPPALPGGGSALRGSAGLVTGLVTGLAVGGRPVPAGLRDIPLPPRPTALGRPNLGQLAERVAGATPDREAGGDLEAADADRWAIQLGAFSDPAVGEAALSRAAAAMPSLLGGAQPRIIAVEGAASPLYRARFVSLSYATASGACSALIAADRSCLTIAPGQ